MPSHFSLGGPLNNRVCTFTFNFSIQDSFLKFSAKEFDNLGPTYSKSLFPYFVFGWYSLVVTHLADLSNSAAQPNLSLTRTSLQEPCGSHPISYYQQPSPGWCNPIISRDLVINSEQSEKVQPENI